MTQGFPPSTVRRAALAPVPGAVSPLLDLACFAILGAAALVLHLRWDEIPERFVTHWGVRGPDGWGARTPGQIFLPLLLGAAVTALLVALRWVLHWALPGGATPRSRATRRLSGLALVGASLLVASTTAAAALTPLAGGPGIVLAVAGVGVAVLPVVLVAATVHLFRLPPDPPGSGPPAAAWRGGLLYVNPADPALWVPKRTGLGYTINLGHRYGWLTLALQILPPLGLALAMALLAR